MRHGTRLAALAALAIGVTTALGATQPVQATTASPAAYDWQYGGKYYDLPDCNASGQEWLDGQGNRAYRCLEEIDSGGGTAYWNLCLGYWVDAAVETNRTVRPAASNPCAGL